MKISWKKFKDNINKLDYTGNLLKKNNSDLEGNDYSNSKQEFDRTKNSVKPDKKVGSDKKIQILYAALFIWVFTIGFYFVLFSGLSQLMGKVSNKIDLKEESSFSVYRPEMDIMNSLDNTGYLKYIQRLYVHPKEKNKMMIMIKPNYWGVIEEEEKNKIKSEVSKKWEQLYKNPDPEKPQKPEVSFSNA